MKSTFWSNPLLFVWNMLNQNVADLIRVRFVPWFWFPSKFSSWVWKWATARKISIFRRKAMIKTTGFWGGYNVKISDFHRFSHLQVAKSWSFQDGQLGFGGRSRRADARPVAMGPALDIRAGGSHTCALEVRGAWEMLEMWKCWVVKTISASVHLVYLVFGVIVGL